jgi:hypothetical protein
MRRTLVLFLALASCPVALPQNALTNDDIIKMVKGGLPDDVILQAIESQPSNFDISAQALIALKQQGVSTAVLNKILTVIAAKQRGGVPAKPVSTPAQSQPPPQAPPPGTPPSQAPTQGTPSPQAQTQGAPPATSVNQGLSPAEEQSIRSLLQQVERMRSQPIEITLSQLLDQGLIDAELPASYNTAFTDLLAPYNQRLHQFVDQEVPLLRQKLNLPITPAAFLGGAPSLFARPARWAPVAVSLNELEPLASSKSPATSLSRRDSLVALSYPQTVGGVQSTSSPGQQGSSVSANLGNGANATVSTNEWVDTGDTVAEGGGMEQDITVNPNTPVGGLKSAERDIKVAMGARVNRCPEADGKDPGTEEITIGGTATVTTTTGTAVGGIYEIHVSTTAEGHVGDDARLRDVVVQTNWSVEKGVTSDPTSFHWGGTATFDPHGSQKTVPIQLTYCSRGLVNFPLFVCSIFFAFDYPIYTLQSAYLKAERKWNFINEGYLDRPPDGVPEWSKCVIAKFTPPTRSVKGQPGQRIPVKAELITANGHQPTWGILKELTPIIKETIEKNGTPTAPDAPAELTYTAALKPWPCNDPPGFQVDRATSRAGAIGGYYDNRSFTWFLAPTCATISIHERTDVDYSMVSMATDATFPMDLSVNEQGQVTGQATVQRSSGQASPCQGGDVWTELWHASGTWDDKTDLFTLKLWFEATARQGVLDCPGPKVVPHFAPGFRSDAFPTPLNRFTLSDQQGAAQHFVIPFTPAARHRIDVTVVSGLSSGAQ